MLEGSRQVGLMLALLPWHWLIQDILAKAPSFLSDFYRPLFLKYDNFVFETTAINELLRLRFVNNRYSFCLTLTSKQVNYLHGKGSSVL